MLSYKAGLDDPLPSSTSTLRSRARGRASIDQPAQLLLLLREMHTRGARRIGKPSSGACNRSRRQRPAERRARSSTTSGAHCCTIVQVFSFDPGVMAYRSSNRLRRSGRVSPNRRDIWWAEAADDRFAYAFSSYVYSGLPLRSGGSRGALRGAPGSQPTVPPIPTSYLRGLRQPPPWPRPRHDRRVGRRRGRSSRACALVTRTLNREARLHNPRDAEGFGQTDARSSRMLERS